MLLKQAIITKVGGPNADKALEIYGKKNPGEVTYMSPERRTAYQAAQKTPKKEGAAKIIADYDRDRTLRKKHNIGYTERIYQRNLAKGAHNAFAEAWTAELARRGYDGSKPIPKAVADAARQQAQATSTKFVEDRLRTIGKKDVDMGRRVAEGLQRYGGYLGEAGGGKLGLDPGDLSNKYNKYVYQTGIGSMPEGAQKGLGKFQGFLDKWLPAKDPNAMYAGAGPLASNEFAKAYGGASKDAVSRYDQGVSKARKDAIGGFMKKYGPWIGAAVAGGGLLWALTRDKKEEPPKPQIGQPIDWTANKHFGGGAYQSARVRNPGFSGLLGAFAPQRKAPVKVNWRHA